MKVVSDPIDRQLLDDWQRDFPITPRPFAVLAEAVSLPETEVIERLSAMHQSGRITRVGATCAPNTLSASTLAAIAVPDHEIELVAEIINQEPGVNHSYAREDHWNLWFVATGPDRAHVNETLARIESNSGYPVLDLRLVRPFNVDLGFRMSGVSRPVSKHTSRPADMSGIQPGDNALMQALTRGMPIVDAPFAALAKELDVTEATVLERIAALTEARVLSRLGVIVRHRALGWRSNAMVVWDIDHDAITEAGPALAALPGITLCYERTPIEGIWPYRLYSMIHAKSRDEAMAVLAKARALPALAGVAHKALFSTRCFRQTGAMIMAKPEVAA